MAKTYTISDLFYTSWSELTGKLIAEVHALWLKTQALKFDNPEYGYLVIGILRRLRKRPLLVDKINEAQAVDIFNDLVFLQQPWHNFPDLQLLDLRTPDDYLARHTFDHFIYADNEFSSYIATKDEKHLRRLVATLYQKYFDKEAVEDIANRKDVKKLKPWQLNLVFFTFAHVRNFVMKRCKTLIPSVKSDPNEKPEPRATGAMWLKIKHRLAETPAFQGYDTAGRGNMYSTLDYLEDLAQIKDEQSRKK